MSILFYLNLSFRYKYKSTSHSNQSSPAISLKIYKVSLCAEFDISPKIDLEMLGCNKKILKSKYCHYLHCNASLSNVGSVDDDGKLLSRRFVEVSPFSTLEVLQSFSFFFCCSWYCINLHLDQLRPPLFIFDGLKQPLFLNSSFA